MRQCEHCGQELEATATSRRRFCSDACRLAWRVANPQYEYVCSYCGKTYRTAYRNRDQYCSRDCAFEAKRLQHTRSIQLCFVRVCLVCGSVLQLQRGAYCSDECRKEQARRYHKRLKESRHYAPPFTCKMCGSDIAPAYGDKRRVFCTPHCAARWEKLQDVEGRRRNNRIRSARMRAARRKRDGGEDIDPFAIFERDGWACYLCGSSTPPHLRGSYEDNAPELDHIVPLAAGGLHRFDNVACSCRKCNNSKGATIPGAVAISTAVSPETATEA